VRDSSAISPPSCRCLHPGAERWNDARPVVDRKGVLASRRRTSRRAIVLMIVRGRPRMSRPSTRFTGDVEALPKRLETARVTGGRGQIVTLGREAVGVDGPDADEGAGNESVRCSRKKSLRLAP